MEGLAQPVMVFLYLPPRHPSEDAGAASRRFVFGCPNLFKAKNGGSAHAGVN